MASSSGYKGTNRVNGFGSGPPVPVPLAGCFCPLGGGQGYILDAVVLLISSELLVCIGIIVE